MGRDFTPTKIKFVNYYNKVQYYEIKKHYLHIGESQSPFNKLMDAFVAGLETLSFRIGSSRGFARLGMKLGQKGTAHVGKIKLRDFMDQVNHVFKRKTKKKKKF